MVVDAEMKEFVNDDHLLKGPIFPKEIFTETDAPAGRASRSQRLHAPKRILHQIDPGGL
jgi:hypothetical protein